MGSRSIRKRQNRDMANAASLQLIEARNDKPRLGVKMKSLRPRKIRLKFKQHDKLPPSSLSSYSEFPYDSENRHYSDDPTDIRNLGRHMLEGVYVAGVPAATAYFGTKFLGSTGVPYATKVAENIIKPSIPSLVAAGLAYKARHTTIPAIKKKYEDAWRGHQYQLDQPDPGTYVQEGEHKSSDNTVGSTYTMNTTKKDFEDKSGLIPIGDPQGLRRRHPSRRGGKRARKRTRKKRRKRRTRRKRKRRKRRTRKK